MQLLFDGYFKSNYCDHKQKSILWLRSLVIKYLTINCIINATNNAANILIQQNDENVLKPKYYITALSSIKSTCTIGPIINFKNCIYKHFYLHCKWQSINLNKGVIIGLNTFIPTIETEIILDQKLPTIQAQVGKYPRIYTYLRPSKLLNAKDNIKLLINIQNRKCELQINAKKIITIAISEPIEKVQIYLNLYDQNTKIAICQIYKKYQKTI